MANKALPQGVAVVTGAAGGMGSACARQLAEAGWTDFLLCDVSEERLEAVAAPLRNAGNTVTILAGDVADPSFPARVIEALRGSRIAALVQTAGLAPAMADPERILSHCRIPGKIVGVANDCLEARSCHAIESAGTSAILIGFLEAVKPE